MKIEKNLFFPCKESSSLSFLVTLFYFTNCKYLFDKHKPPPLKSRLARARGLEVNVNVGHQSPACGLKFGEAGLLGRGHGRDLDSDTECVQGFLYSISNY